MADSSTVNTDTATGALTGDFGAKYSSNATNAKLLTDTHTDRATDNLSLQKESNGTSRGLNTIPQEINGEAAVGSEQQPESQHLDHPTEEPAAKPTEKSLNISTGSGKKASNGPTKRRSSGVPEHRSRKSSNKKKKEVITQLDAAPGALYLARMKGHQPWPSIICDEDMLPTILIQTRPVSAAQADGTFKKVEFEKGGRRENERSFPVMFLYTNEFAWIPNTELTPITPSECAEAVGKQKSKTLSGAYNIASEGHGLEHFKQVLLEHQEMLEAEAEAKADRKAKKAEKVPKPKRKSDAVLSSSDDKMDVDAEKKTKTKKRKKETSADDDEKPAKTQKTGPTKLKLNMTPKAPASEQKKKAAKAKQSSKRSNTKNTGSEDEAAPKPLEEVLSASQLREKKEKEVRYIRHKLQKGFLSRDTVPGDDEIETMSTYLGKVEAHPDLESSILRATKIHKVLKAMIRLDSIPKDEEYHFKKRSKELLDKWNRTLASDPGAGADRDEDSKLDSTVTKQEGIEEQPNVVSAEQKSSVPEKPSDKRDKENPTGANQEDTDTKMQEHPAATQLSEGSNSNVANHGKQSDATTHQADEVSAPQHEDINNRSPAVADIPMKG